MTLEKLESMIDKALADAEIRPKAMKRTNILNAEYALGKYFAIMEIIEDLYGTDEYIRIAEKTEAVRDELFQRTQEIY